MSDFERTNCAVCSKDNTETYSTKGQFGLDTNVVICKNCGFSYLNPRWTISRYNSFYAKEYDHYYREETISNPDSEIEFRNIKAILSRANELNIDLGKPLRILDIGSGMGHSLIYLKTNVWKDADYFAIEPSEFCQNHLKSKGISVLTNDVYSNWENGNDQKFDLVIMRHVLEHFNTPVEILKKVNSVLSENGILFIAVPDSMNPTKPLKTNYFRVVHVSYFSAISLKNVLGLAGLETLQLKEGDQYERYELFAYCKKGKLSNTPNINSGEFGKQKAIYNSVGKNDFYYTNKAKLIRILRRLKILK